MTDLELRGRAQERIGWVLDGNYPEPSDELKPFVFALMTRAIEGEDDDDVARALEALRKLFPPRVQ
jgi:hypothetical protein